MAARSAVSLNVKKTRLQEKFIMRKLLSILVLAALGMAPVVWAQETIKIGIGHGPTHSFTQAMERFGQSLEKKRPGEYKVQIYHSSQLGSERVMQEALTLGSLEITVTGLLNIFEPKFALLEAPFLFRDRDHILKVQESDVVQKLAATLPPKGLRLVGFVENGFRHITNNVRPINTPADVKGLKIRTPENLAQVETFRALGAQPTPMPFAELYNALRQGVVDGQENPLQNIYDGKLYEAQKYLALTGHIYNSAYVVISEQFFRKQKPDQQKAILEAAREATLWQFNYIRELDSKLLDTLKQQGMQVTSPDQVAFRTATAPAYEAFYAKLGPDAKAIVESIRSVK
jgi:tripartite ATP-independent transporter DctP family solute receptor